MTINVTIEGEGLSLKKETSLQKAGQIIAFLGSEEGSIGVVPGTQPHSPTSLMTSSATSPNDLINEAKAKTNAQKMTVLGKYLSEKDGTDGFLIKEILLQLRKMGDEPGNFTRDLKKAVNDLQYIYEIDLKAGKYGVSEKGLNAIQNKFADEVRRPSTKGRGGFKKAIPPRPEVVSLPIVSTLSGYPDFHPLPTKADSILWVLAYADSQKITDLTPKEVEIITDKLHNKIAQNAFSPFNKRNIKAGYVAQTDGKFKIQQKGLDRLKALTVKETHVKA